MTSPITDAPTREYFQREQFCGLKPDQVQFFVQGQLPALNASDGKILMSAPDSLALSPDGHGGIVEALAANGVLQAARTRGIKNFYYAQIDNPLAEACDPLLIGYHILAHSQMTTQVIRKRFAKEKVGNVVSVEGHAQIIEYSDLPDSVAMQTNADGALRLWAGNIAVHVFDVEFLMAISESAAGLPYHRALKKLKYVDDQGNLVSSEELNALKFERFVFDLLPLADRTLVVEADPARVFAPVKNADGAEVDTPELAKAAMLRLHRAWLEEAGATLDENVSVEIHPRWALDEVGVQEKITKPIHFGADTFLM